MPDKRLEQLPLSRCQMHLQRRSLERRTRFELGSAGADTGWKRLVDQMIVEIDGPPSELHWLDELWLGGAPGHGSNSCEELLHAEGLGDVVVGTGIKGIHLGCAVQTSGEDHDGHLRPRA